LSLEGGTHTNTPEGNIPIVYFVERAIGQHGLAGNNKSAGMRRMSCKLVEWELTKELDNYLREKE